MSKAALKEWLKLDSQTKQNIFNEVALKKGLPDNAIEKDWRVVHVLSLLFSMSCAEAMIFKGGTSLNKAWNLIQRFSEDIDLSLNREFLGYSSELNTRDIKNLRKASCNFINTLFIDELKVKFEESGLIDVTVKVREHESHGQDPIIVEIYYKKVTETDSYLKPGLLVEIGSRSLIEPFTPCAIKSLIADNFAGKPFADDNIIIPTANPERTFLEKIFLLHEEFQKPQDKIRVEQLSRHLYDIEKLMHHKAAMDALHNENLYNAIVTHRSKLTRLQYVDYTRHKPQSIRFIPPHSLLSLWEEDYRQMQENMIFGDSLSFAKLIEKLTELQNKINDIRR